MSQENPTTRSQAIDEGFMAAEILGSTFAHAAHLSSQPQTVEGVGRRTAAGSFRGQMEVAGLLSPLPAQNFTLYYPAHNRVIIESERSRIWPKFKLDLEVNPEGEPKLVRGVHIDPADKTAEAEILYTRVVFALTQNGFYRLLDLDNNQELKLKIHAAEDDWFILRSKICRKLKYIEEFFGVRFRIPEASRKGDANSIEMAFRGITETEFVLRQSQITINGYRPKEGDLNQPAFSAPGSFTYTFADGIGVFNQLLDVGPITIHIERAVATDRDLIENLRRGSLQRADLRVASFDHQIKYTFVNYVDRSSALGEQLERFKRQLLAVEPPELVDLLTASVKNDVSADEAHKIAVGWLQFYDFPDRYWPQEPIFEGDQWRVPVWVAYSDSRGAPVADVFITTKTGRLTAPVSVEEMRSLGKSVAKTIPRAE